MGVRSESAAVIIAATEGVVCRDFRRRPEGERWNREMLDGMKGAPWQPTPGRDSIEVRCRVNVPSDGAPFTEPVRGIARETGPKGAKLYESGLARFGYTVGCPGCRAAVRGKEAQSHSEECRKRIEKELRKEGNQRLEKADERMKNREAEDEGETDTTGAAAGSSQGGGE